MAMDLFQWSNGSIWLTNLYTVCSGLAERVEPPVPTPFQANAK